MSSRGPSPFRRRPRTESSFPVLPIAIGMIIVGLVIGAALGTQRQRHNAVAVAAASPTLLASPAPTASPTALPTEQPSPTPVPLPSPTRTFKPTRAAIITPKAPVRPSRTMVPTPMPQSSPLAVATSPPKKPSAVVKAAPPKQSAAPQAPAAPKVAAATKSAASQKTIVTPVVERSISIAQATPLSPEEQNDQRLVNDAKETVRTYLNALISGDESTASAQLVNAGMSGLSERSILDASARITDLSGRVTSPTTAIVDADIQTSNGLYYGHYELRRLDSGIVLIAQHSFVRS